MNKITLNQNLWITCCFITQVFLTSCATNPSRLNNDQEVVILPDGTQKPEGYEYLNPTAKLMQNMANQQQEYLEHLRKTTPNILDKIGKEQ